MKNIILSLFAISLSACSFPQGLLNDPQKSTTATTSFNVSNMDPQLKAAALAILNQNCTSCHTQSSGPAGVYNLTDANHLFSSGLLIAGSPDSSPLFISIKSGVMPPSGALSTADQNTLRDFIIAAGASGSGINQPPPPPTPEPTFTYIESQILGPKCTGCHNQTSAAAGYAFDTYTSTLKAVSKSTPTGSKLYTETQQGSMPPSPRTPLASDEVNLILTWIQNGALNN
ncbi:MAG: c-type cytochrome domain-containing protein [Bdellovibrio sp.]